MLESGIVIAFAATCVVVFAFAAVAFMRAALRVRELAAHAKTIVPTSLLLQMRVAGRDAQSLSAGGSQFASLALRAAVAVGSIALSLATYRALLERIRTAF